MMRDHLEMELSGASLSEMEMDANRVAVRGALVGMILADKRQNLRRLRYLFPIGVAAGFALGVLFMRAAKPSEQPRVADDLGSIWCTYIDTSDADAVIWPPHSTNKKNNFVKSSPGYGDEGYAVRFKGSVGHRDKQGYMGVAATLGAPCLGTHCAAGVDIQKFSKIRFKMKGHLKGGELVLRISGDGGAPSNAAFDAIDAIADAYEATITDWVGDEWRTVTLDLRKDFAPTARIARHPTPDIEDILADARQLKWHVRNGKRAVADVWIDELEFF